jgi:hypothetical protein
MDCWNWVWEIYQHTYTSCRKYCFFVKFICNTFSVDRICTCITCTSVWLEIWALGKQALWVLLGFPHVQLFLGKMKICNIVCCMVCCSECLIKSNNGHLWIQEPFIAVAVGGQSVPGGNPGTLLVWAITAHGRVSTCFKYFWGCDKRF